jgi:hypothetical protein
MQKEKHGQAAVLFVFGQQQLVRYQTSGRQSGEAVLTTLAGFTGIRLRLISITIRSL